MSFVVRMTRLRDLELGEQFLAKVSREAGASGFTWTRDREAAQRFPRGR